jgi:hypothetical protein
MSEFQSGSAALSAAAFISSIGINTHTGTWDASYGLPGGTGGDPSKIEAELAYLGIDSIRDTLEYSWQLPEYQQLAAAGVKFDLFIGAGTDANSLAQQVAQIASLAPDVRSVEGPNESDNWPVTYDGETGLPATILMQQALYSLVNGTPALAGVPVIESSLGNASSYAALAGLGNATYGNTHSYFFDFSQTIASQIPARIAQEGTVAPGLPTIATEAGWSTADSTAFYGSVDPLTQAKLTLDLLFDQFNAGVAATYLYQLMDEPQLDDTYGLFNVDGTPKPAATALHNLTTILSAGTGGSAAPATLGTLPYTLTGMPATGETSLLEQGNGAYDLALWNEAPIWNPSTETEIAVGAVPVTVALGGTYAAVALYDPLQGTAAIQTWSNVSTIQVAVQDHPVIIVVSPNPPAAPTITGLTAATDTGVSSTDGVTDDPTPTIIGTAPAGSTVTLQDSNGAVLGTATAGAASGGGSTGAWSIAVATALGAGVHSLTATATAAVDGQTSASSASYAVDVDLTAPLITAIADSLAAGTALQSGQTDRFTLATSEPVVVTGAPTLLLSDGGVATCDSADSTAAALVFDYVPTTTQVSSDLQVEALALQGGTIEDIAGNMLGALGLAALPGSDTGVTVNDGPPTVTLGSGPDTLALSIDEDYYLADAEFTIEVDGVQIGGVQTTTAIRSAGQSQTFDVEGTFAAGQHTVTLDFLNDAYAGTPQTDRNLYLNEASIDGTPIYGSTLSLLSGGPEWFAYGAPSAPIDSLILDVSQDAWLGDAEFTVTVDGTQVGGVYTATASHAAGAINALTLNGAWGSGTHTVGISFINDAYGGSSAADRNLYVDGAFYDGIAVASPPLALFWDGTQTLHVQATPSASALTLELAEDAYQGDAQFTVAVDGNPIGAPQSVTVSNASGSAEAFSFNDVLSAGIHDVAISFINDLYGGSPSTDRNLYVKGAEFDGTKLTGWAAPLLSDGTVHFSLVVPPS